MNPYLIECYKNTTYHAETEFGVVLIHINQIPGPILSLLLDKYKATTWAFITAWNPGSGKKSDEENRLQNLKLMDVIISKSCAYFLGEGKGDNLNWPPEASFLVLGISKMDAMKLGNKFQQNAVVFGKKNQPAQLLLCV